MAITALPTPPLRSDPTNFAARADAFLAALPTLQEEINATAAAMNLNATNDTSASSVLIGTGSKTFTVASGKSFQKGMYLTIANTALPSTNSMWGIVTSYATTSLVVDVLSIRGSGTLAAWTISQSAPNAEFAGAVAIATDKPTPVDADELPLIDSAASFGLKSLTWANLKAGIKTYLSGAAFPIGSTTPSTVAATTLSASGKLTVGAKAILEAPSWDTGYLALRHSALAETAATSALFQSAGGSTFLNSVAGQSLYLGINGAVVGAVTSTGLAVTGALSATNGVQLGNSKELTWGGVFGAGIPTIAASAASGIVFFPTGSTTGEAARFDLSGNLLVGAATSASFGSAHRITKAGAEGSRLLSIDGGVDYALSAFAASGGGYSLAAAALHIGKNSGTSRSINAAGTVNASGADYAEYESNNGLMIAKGDIVGFKADGTLTNLFADAVRFAIKSTNPSYVGGDTWGSEGKVGRRPDEPQRVADKTEQREVTPAIAATETDSAVEATFETFILEAGDTDAGWGAKQAAYETAKATFESALEAARQQVDRIAYSGKVPCNVLGATPGGYIIASELDGHIAGQFVADPDFAQYKRAVGRVNRLLPDGRCEVAVIIH